MLKTVLRHLFTGRDCATHDLGRYSWALCFAAVCALAAFHCYRGTPPTVTELATALVAVAGGHAAALWAKRDTEPTN